MNSRPLIFFICLLAISGYSQNQSVEAEFSEKLGRANALRDSSTYRATTKSEHFMSASKSGKVDYSEIRESIPPDLWRTIKLTTFNGKKRKVEQIGEDGTFYERIDDGAWVRFRGGTGSDTSSQTVAKSESYRYLGQATLRRMITDLYEVRSERTTREINEGQTLITRISVTKFWFLKDGHLFQSARESTIKGKPDIDRLTTTYEYGPKDINFKLPIQ